MGSTFAIAQDERHVGLRDAKHLGYFGLRHAAFQTPDFGDFLGCQKFFESGNASDVDGVLSVAGVVNPFEIGHGVVGFNAIDVIDHRMIGRVRDEGKSYQSVNMYRLAQSIPEEIDIPISEFVRARSEDLSIYSSGFKPVADAVQASNSAEIAHLVEVPEVCDRNGSPFFNESVIHKAGRPSGVIGLMIKDPPRATTFGGPAFMARHSEGCNLTSQ